MSDEDETTTEETEERGEPRKWAWINFWSIMMSAFGAWCGLINAVANDISNLMDEHHDYQANRQQMMEQGAREIEALTKHLESVEVGK